MTTILNTNICIKFCHDNKLYLWFISFAQRVRQLIKKVVNISRNGWSIDTKADPFVIGK